MKIILGEKMLKSNKKYRLFVYTVILLITIKSSVSLAGLTHFSVGFSDACDFESIKQAINTEILNFRHLHLVSGVYNESIHIEDMHINITGGYATCADAETQTRTPGSTSTIQAVKDSRVITIRNDNEDTVNINLVGLHITGGSILNAKSAGGGILVGSGGFIGDAITLSIQESLINNNATTFYAGGIYAGSNTSVFLKDTIVEDNSSHLGGGIYCSGCFLNIDSGSGIINNTAHENGGGIYLTTASSANIYTGTSNPSDTGFGIHSNQAVSQGGGIYLKNSQLLLLGLNEIGFFGNNIDPVNITSNEAGQQGGGIYADNSTINSVHIDVSDNRVGQAGAGIYLVNSSQLYINTLIQADECWNTNKSQCNRFVDNLVQNGAAGDGSGGALHVSNSFVRINKTWFQGNNAGGDGGGLGAAITFVNSSDFTSVIDNSVFYDNGYLLGEDLNIIRNFRSDVRMRHVTMVDNNISQALITTRGSLGVNASTSLLNSIVHNNNGDDVFLIQVLSDFEINCVITHDDSSFPAGAINVADFYPEFVNRDSGALELTSSSVGLIDVCPILNEISNLDLALRARNVDLIPMGNDGANYADIGAYEWPGFDTDLIFINGFE